MKLILLVHGFWALSGAVVLLSVTTCFVIFNGLGRWLSGRMGFLDLALMSGLISYAVNPILMEFNLRAQTELGMAMYIIFVLTNLVLWAVGLFLAFELRDMVTLRWHRWRQRTRHLTILA